MNSIEIGVVTTLAAWNVVRPVAGSERWIEDQTWRAVLQVN